MDFLSKLGILEADAREILQHDREYGAAIQRLSQEYMSFAPKQFFRAYREGQRAESTQRRDTFLREARAVTGEENVPMAELLFWLHCVPYARAQYRQMGIPEEIFWDTVKDIGYKLEECKQVSGKCGVVSTWFFLHFDWQLATFGRLQYQVRGFPKDHYAWAGFELNYGDPVYACHIPSSGKLSEELCLDSLQRAYEFLKKDLRSNILPVVCSSWMLFPPYVEKVFGDGSNLKAFAKMFDVVDVTPRESFEDGWRIFGPAFQGSTEGLPQDNSLRRNMVRYIKDGGEFGFGYGVLLYDGEKKKILNRQNTN